MPHDLQTRLAAQLSATYEIERELVGGGMSRLFIALERHLGRRVVIKVLPEELASPSLAARFRREIALLASLRHPNIVPLLNGGDAGGLLFYTMPFIQGESLRARLDAGGQVSIAEAVHMALEIAQALGYAHRRGVVHRDLKPANVLLDDGRALVSDFGIARVLGDSTAGLTGTGLAVGSPGYMAPEQLAADPDIDQRADAYAFGAVLYEVLAGRRPFTGTVHEVLRAQVVGEIEPLRRIRPDVPARLEQLVERALRPDPADRWQSADEVAAELETLSAARPAAAWPSIPVIPMRWRRRAAALTAAGIVAAAGVAYVAVQRGVAASRSAPASVAVLPFVNMSDSTNEFFADGMTEELINALATVEGLRVPARTSSFAFKGRNVDMRVVAGELGVRHVVEGSVRRDGNRVRVTAQLIDASDGFHVWTRSFDGDLRNVFDLQERISREIVAALLPRLIRPSSDRIVSASTSDPEAYALYLQGQQEFHRRIGPSLYRAIELYRAAIARDPRFAPAFAGLSMAYAQLPNYTSDAPRDALDSAAGAALRAVALDANSAEALTALGNVRLRQQDFIRAAEMFSRALRINPNYAQAHQWYAYALRGRGRMDAAIEHAQKARSLDPMSMPARLTLAQMYLSARRFDDAETEYQRLLAADTSNAASHLNAGAFYMAAGRYAEAIPHLERGAVAMPEAMLLQGMLAYSYARTGRRGDAERVAELVSAWVRSNPSLVERGAVGYAWVLEARGEGEAAAEWIERLYGPEFPHPLNHPLFDIFRKYERFRALESRARRSGISK